MRKIALLVSIFLLVLTASAYSDCHVRSRNTYSSYNQQHYYYYHNGHYHQYHGGNHGQLYYHNNGYYYPYKEQIILVPKAIQVEVYRDHYYSIQGAAQQDLLADAIVGRLLRMQQGAAGARVTPPAGGAPAGRAPADTSPVGAGSFQDAEMLKTVNESCAKCHGPASKYTKFVTSDGKLPDLPAGKVWEAFGLVNSGEMPKGGKSLSDEQVKQFYSWAKSAKR